MAAPDTGTGQVLRGRIWPTCRDTLRVQLELFDDAAVKPPRTVAVRDGLITDDTDQPGAATVNARGGVLLPGDPTVDITAVRQVRGVWIGGLGVG